MRCEQWEAIEKQRKATTQTWRDSQKPKHLHYAVVVDGFPPKSTRGVFNNPYKACGTARGAGLQGRSRVLGFRTEAEAGGADISSVKGAVKVIHI